MIGVGQGGERRIIPLMNLLINFFIINQILPDIVHHASAKPS